MLTKSYEFAVEKDKRNPLMTTHNALYKCLGCEINWNEGKCPLKDNINENNEDDEPAGSFFDFFRTHTSDGVRPAFKEKSSGESKNGNGKSAIEQAVEEEEFESLFELDYEIGKFIKDMIIPKALLYYTGEITELDDDEDDDDEFEDDDDEDTGDEDDDDDNENDDDSEDEPDSKPTKKKVKTK